MHHRSLYLYFSLWYFRSNIFYHYTIDHFLWANKSLHTCSWRPWDQTREIRFLFCSEEKLFWTGNIFYTNRAYYPTTHNKKETGTISSLQYNIWKYLSCCFILTLDHLSLYRQTLWSMRTCITDNSMIHMFTFLKHG